MDKFGRSFEAIMDDYDPATGVEREKLKVNNHCYDKQLCHLCVMLYSGIARQLLFCHCKLANCNGKMNGAQLVVIVTAL